METATHSITVPRIPLSELVAMDTAQWDAYSATWRKAQTDLGDARKDVQLAKVKGLCALTVRVRDDEYEEAVKDFKSSATNNSYAIHTVGRLAAEKFGEANIVKFVSKAKSAIEPTAGKGWKGLSVSEAQRLVSVAQTAEALLEALEPVKPHKVYLPKVTGRVQSALKAFTALQDGDGNFSADLIAENIVFKPQGWCKKQTTSCRPPKAGSPQHIAQISAVQDTIEAMRAIVEAWDKEVNSK